jgi:hypothetical protein
MIWGVIIGFLLFLFIFNYFERSRKAKKIKTSGVDELAFIRKAADQHAILKEGKLGGQDEVVAQRVRKLVYDASFYESRNQAAFDDILKELTEITKTVLKEGGQKRMQLIITRVEQLCGNESSYLSGYLDTMRKAYL